MDKNSAINVFRRFSLIQELGTEEAADMVLADEARRLAKDKIDTRQIGIEQSERQRVSAVLSEASWDVWGDSKLDVYMWQAVLLSMNLEPRGNESLGLFMADQWRTVRNGVPVPGADAEIYRIAKELEDLLPQAVHGFRGSKPVHLENPKPDDPNWRVVSLGEFGAWAAARGWDIAKQLPRDAPAALNSAEPLGTRQRRTLLVVIAALCRKAGIDPNSRGASTQIASATEELGVPVGEDSIRTMVRDIPDAIESRSS